MNEKKQGGFKLSYVIVILVVLLLFALLFVDFGDNGRRIDQSDVKDLLNGTYTISEEEPTPLKATFVYFKNSVGYIIVEGSRYQSNQMPTYSDFYFNCDSSFMNSIREAI